MIFSKRGKQEYIVETLNSCNKLLNNIFHLNLKKDLSRIKENFPKGTKREDLKLTLKKVILILEHETLSSPSIEVFLNIDHKEEEEIGWYSLIWNNEDKLIDEYFVLE